MLPRGECPFYSRNGIILHVCLYACMYCRRCHLQDNKPFQRLSEYFGHWLDWVSELEWEKRTLCDCAATVGHSQSSEYDILVRFGANHAAYQNPKIISKRITSSGEHPRHHQQPQKNSDLVSVPPFTKSRNQTIAHRD